ncbi:11437_t:CDS:2 [Scutellospora calospora]|uniref:11437_t:CDS:1 n=1 Tax=Scutellospora calospora TaxID=85575 RepID=A0ACA9MKT7_9GLOM|nr:11437_t:CDS:2 [Scutellospora calospora]
MTDNKETDPLQLLMYFTANNLTPQLLDQSNNVVSKLQDATYIQFDSLRFDKNMTATSFQGLSHQCFPLSVLYHATATRELDFTKYNEDATEEKFTSRLNYTERKQWLNFVSGYSPLINDPDKNLFGKTSEKRRHDNLADNDHQNAAEIKRQKKTRFDRDKIWMENYQKNHKATSSWPWEESLESKDKEENYSQFIQYADIYFLKVKNRDLPAQERPGHLRAPDSFARTHYRSDVRQSSKTPRNPLILVPSAPSAFITMFNIKQLLQDARFEDQVSLRNEQKKENLIKINRNGKIYEFTDLVDNLQQSDWNRVVCVITDGSEWLFKKYLWKTPQETFNHGVYFKYNHDEVKKNVTWRNVHCINIHRELRHKDSEAYTEFWNIVEKARY